MDLSSFAGNNQPIFCTYSPLYMLHNVFFPSHESHDSACALEFTMTTTKLLPTLQGADQSPFPIEDNNAVDDLSTESPVLARSSYLGRQMDCLHSAHVTGLRRLYDYIEGVRFMASLGSGTPSSASMTVA